MPSDVTYISFSNNSIALLESDAFLAWRSLGTLFVVVVVVAIPSALTALHFIIDRLLDNNIITGIDTNAFAGLDGLVTLFVAHQ